MMKQETTSTALSDVVARDLEELLGAFGSQFSLEDIASAYCQSKRNVNVAAYILCSVNGNIVGSAIDAASKDKLEGAETTSLELPSDNVLHNTYEERNARVLKSKNLPLSMGTVSGIIGKEYIKTKPLTNNSHEPRKPMKLDSKEFPTSEIWSEEIQPNMMGKSTPMRDDVEEFLFRMLGDGFQLDKTVIQDVLGRCGYDTQKSTEKLIELSASTLKKCDDVVNIAAEKSTENCPGEELLFQQERKICSDSSQSDGATSMTRNLRKSPKRDIKRFGLQKEVLESLFIAPERTVEAPKITRTIRPVRKSRASGKVVVGPHKDNTKEYTVAEPKEDTRDADENDENNYEVLRKGVKEYWITMREYYKAAVDAFVKGDHAQATKLLEQGHFLSQKVCEADRKSAEKLIEARNDEVMTFDWHAVEPKEAVRLLRVHLTSLSSIPTIKNLRIIVGNNNEDTKTGPRKRMILKQLEKESIKWTEDENGQVILIRVDVIDPKCLSFAKNK